jgi:hypothetical protein
MEYSGYDRLFSGLWIYMTAVEVLVVMGIVVLVGAVIYLARYARRVLDARSRDAV